MRLLWLAHLPLSLTIFHGATLAAGSMVRNSTASTETSYRFRNANT